MSMLEVKNLVKTYGKGDSLVKAVDDVSFEVEEGEFVAIIGASGSGKSTLLHMIGGVDRATSGEILVDGENIVKYREENGRFTDRKQLLKVDKLGPKAFLQCAGFLRISDGDNPLDHTSVHPETYEAVDKLLKMYHLTLDNETNKTIIGLKLMIKDYKKE